jgi:hypothetical protein
VQDNISGVSISEIYNDGWKTSFNYIKSASPSKSDFLIRAENYSATAEICLRTRKPSASSYSFEKCDNIEIKPYTAQPIQKPINVSSNKSIEVNNTTTTLQNTTPRQTIKNLDFIPSTSGVEEKTEIQSSSSTDKIYLNPKSKATETFVTKGENLRLYAVYSFTLFAIILVIFLSMKRL